MTPLSPLEFAERLDTLVLDWIDPTAAALASVVEVYADGSVCFWLRDGRKIWPKYQPEIRTRIKDVFHK